MTVSISDLAQFVENEWRYSQVSDTATKAASLSAQHIELNTNLDQAGGDALAAELLADYKRSTMIYQVTLDGCDAFSLDSFNSKPPMVQVNLPNLKASLQRVQLLTVDFNARTTTVKSRG